MKGSGHLPELGQTQADGLTRSPNSSDQSIDVGDCEAGAGQGRDDAPKDVAIGGKHRFVKSDSLPRDSSESDG